MATQYAYGTKTSIQIDAHWCNGCGIPYGLPEGFIDLRLQDHQSWTCPNGCVRHYPAGKTAEQKLKEAAARETALNDQLGAAVRDAENIRQALLRDRVRFANGVCPCCSRSFENVRRHMASKHPDYDVTKVAQHAAPKIRCSCGREFENVRGLRTHQGHQRRDGWDKPSAGAWSAHLTVVAR